MSNFVHEGEQAASFNSFTTPDKVEIATLIAAVGNIEAKSATYGLLPDNMHLSPSEIKHQIESRQGHDVRITSPSVYGNYCGGSFVSIGLVARAFHEITGSVRYQRITDERALAVCGLMLSTSLDTPGDIGLRDIWSSTSIPMIVDGNGDAIQRGPEGRLQIFKTLAKNTGRIAVSSLEMGVDHTATAEHLVELRRIGIIEYDSIDGKTINPVVSINKGVKPNGTLRQLIAEIIEDNGGTLEKRELLDKLTPRYKSRQRAQSILNITLTDMQKAGMLQIGNPIKRDEFSRVSIASEWDETIKQLVDNISIIESDDHIGIDGMIDNLMVILDDPQKLSYLMHKSFENSRLSRYLQGRTKSISVSVLELLAQRPMNTSELSEILDANRRSVRVCLNILAKNGHIATDKDGAYTLAFE